MKNSSFIVVNKIQHKKPNVKVVYINEKKKRRLVVTEQVYAFLLSPTCFMLTEIEAKIIQKRIKKL